MFIIITPRVGSGEPSSNGTVVEVLRKPVVSFATVATAKIIVIISAIFIVFITAINNFSKHLLSKINHLISKTFLHAPTRQVKIPRRSNCGWSHQVQLTKVESTTSAYFVRWLHAFFFIFAVLFFYLYFSMISKNIWSFLRKLWANAAKGPFINYVRE